MSISSIGMSYTQLQQASTLTVKGQDSSSEEKSSNSVESSGSMDTVQLSEEATGEYKIGNDSVTQAEFDKYDTDGDGEISASEQAAYEADQTDAAEEEDSDLALLEAMEEAQEEDEEESSAMYSQYGGMSIRGESGQSVNATA